MTAIDDGGSAELSDGEEASADLGIEEELRALDEAYGGLKQVYVLVLAPAGELVTLTVYRGDDSTNATTGVLSSPVEAPFPIAWRLAEDVTDLTDYGYDDVGELSEPENPGEVSEADLVGLIRQIVAAKL